MQVQRAEDRMDDDGHDFLDARDPATGLEARTVALMVLFAGRRLGAEVIPVGEAEALDEQIARAVDNVRRAIALFCGRFPGWEYGERMRAAVESSEPFCVAVSLSAAHIEHRRERHRRREQMKLKYGPRRRP